MTPKQKVFLKVLASYWLASICMAALVGNLGGRGHADAPFTDSFLVGLLIAPFGAATTIFFAMFAVFKPGLWPDIFCALLAFALPFAATLSLLFQRPARWYVLFKR